MKPKPIGIIGGAGTPFLELLELVHQKVALPTVAGHPTGGAVDITLTYRGKEIDMGGKIADFSQTEKLPTFSPAVSLTKAMNRKFLHDLMVSVGFAPFYLEWWHFSFGDLEWAAFYDKSASIYAPFARISKCGLHWPK